MKGGTGHEGSTALTVSAGTELSEEPSRKIEEDSILIISGCHACFVITVATFGE